MPIITITIKDGFSRSQRYQGHEEEKGRIIEVQKGKGKYTWGQKRRILYQLPECSNGKEMAVGISNSYLIMKVLKIVD